MGAPLATIRGHTGRGIWRCALGPGTLLATGGADGSIKLWPVASALSPSSWPQGSTEPQVCSAPDGLGSGAGSTSLSHADTRESTLRPGGVAFQLQHCWPQGWGGWEKDSVCGLDACVADSKSEWLRCIALAGEDVLYAATNLGYAPPRMAARDQCSRGALGEPVGQPTRWPQLPAWLC